MNHTNPINITATAMTVRQQFGGLLNQVALQGAEVTIERAGKPIAKIVPIHQLPSGNDHKSLPNGKDHKSLPSGKDHKSLPSGKDHKSLPSGKLDFRDFANLNTNVWKGIDPDSFLQQERESWT